MPTYQYVCTDCQNDLEAVQSFSEPSLSVCPSCGGKLRKRFGAVGVVFKGSGFYRNDSRSDGRGGSSERKSDGEKSTTETKAESKSETKSESKSETKSETKSDSGAKKSSSGSSGSGSSGSSSSSGSGSKATSAA